MKYSVVIPMFNAQSTIGECLEALANQELLPDEVIIVDNNSTDKSAQVVQGFMGKTNKFPIILMHESKRGPAAARNKGISIAYGDIIVFTDSDCIARNDWIKNINEVFLREDPDAVGGFIDVRLDERIAQKFQAAHWIWDRKFCKRNILTSKEGVLKYEAVSTHNLAFKRIPLLEMGGFDDLYHFASEDFDLWMRALDKGYKVICWEPTMVVCHIKKETVWKIIKQAFQYQDGTMRLIKTHLANRIIIYLPIKGFIVTRSFGFTVFVGNTSLEIIFLLVIACVNFWVFAGLVVLGLGFYTYKVHRKFKRYGIRANLFEDFESTLILILRGLLRFICRIYCSFKYRMIAI